MAPFLIMGDVFWVAVCFLWKICLSEINYGKIKMNIITI